MRLLLFLMVFLVLSTLLVISNNHLAFYKHEDRAKFSEIYSSWADQVFFNIQTIVKDFVDLKWFPDNNK